MRFLFLMIAMILCSCGPENTEPHELPSTTKEFKQRLKQVLNAADCDAFWQMVYGNKMSLSRENRKQALAWYDKEMTLRIDIVKYYPGSITSPLTPQGYLVFTEEPDYYCLVVQHPRDDDQIEHTFEFGLCRVNSKIYICGRKYVEERPRERRLPEFRLVTLDKDQASENLRETEGNPGWGTCISGFILKNFTMDNFTRFLEDELNVDIENTTNLEGAYTFDAPIGDQGSISRAIIGLRWIGLDLVEK